MKKLLKAYGFNSDMQYFEMIVESVINGQRTQAFAEDSFKRTNQLTMKIKHIFTRKTKPIELNQWFEDTPQKRIYFVFMHQRSFFNTCLN